MNYLEKFGEFKTIEQGEKNLKEAYNLRDQMGGALYWTILNDDCREISQKLEDLRNAKNQNS